MNNIIAYSMTFPGKGYSNDKWDFGIIQEIFDKYKIPVIQTTDSPTAERAFVVAPGFEWSGNERFLNKQIKNIDRVVLIITADESSRFNPNLIRHPNISIWLQYPSNKYKGYDSLPTGAPSHFNTFDHKYPSKDTDIYFAGQVNHQRRKQLSEAIVGVPGASYDFTPGFAQGNEPKEYYRILSKAKFAPAPAGVVSIDSFRVYEALELLCLPILDKISSSGIDYGYWEMLFGKHPFPEVSDWHTLATLTEELISNYPANMHKAVSWWIQYKRNIGIKMMEQINEH